ncbi:elastin-like [Macrobrachium rosenbergii]|uniref:elastin-like n=1 Tax=Macrobrachium rosenbergii TaxID=79674 RepID=UPI0034D64546
METTPARLGKWAPLSGKDFLRGCFLEEGEGLPQRLLPGGRQVSCQAGEVGLGGPEPTKGKDLRGCFRGCQASLGGKVGFLPGWGSGPGEGLNHKGDGTQGALGKPLLKDTFVRGRTSSEAASLEEGHLCQGKDFLRGCFLEEGRFPARLGSGPGEGLNHKGDGTQGALGGNHSLRALLSGKDLPEAASLEEGEGLPQRLLPWRKVGFLPGWGSGPGEGLNHKGDGTQGALGKPLLKDTFVRGTFVWGRTSSEAASGTQGGGRTPLSGEGLPQRLLPWRKVGFLPGWGSGPGKGLNHKGDGTQGALGKPLLKDTFVRGRTSSEAASLEEGEGLPQRLLPWRKVGFLPGWGSGPGEGLNHKGDGTQGALGKPLLKDTFVRGRTSSEAASLEEGGFLPGGPGKGLNPKVPGWGSGPLWEGPEPGKGGPEPTRRPRETTP